MPGPISLAERQRIVALRSSGYKITEIQNITGVTRKCIYFWLRRWEQSGNLSARHRAVYERATTKEIDAAIVAAHEGDPLRSTKSTSSQFRISMSTVQRRLRAARLKSREPSQNLATTNEHNHNQTGTSLAQDREARWQDSQVNQMEPQVILEELEDKEYRAQYADAVVREFSPPNDWQVEPTEWDETKMDLEDVAKIRQTFKGAVQVAVKQMGLVAEDKGVGERVQCSRCSAFIEQQATLFRCVECVDAALCCACAPVAHATHCLMRLPSTRVYRVLEDIFQQLRLDVRARLYPYDDMGHLDEASCDKQWLDAARGSEGGTCSNEAAPAVTQVCVHDEGWLNESADQADREEQLLTMDADPLLQQIPLEANEEDSDEEPADELTGTTQDFATDMAQDAVATSTEESIRLRPQDSRNTRSRNKVTSIGLERLKKALEKEETIRAEFSSTRSVAPNVTADQKERISFNRRKRQAQEQAYSLEVYEESTRKISKIDFSRARLPSNQNEEQELTERTSGLGT